MKVTDAGTTAVVELEEYRDLLAVRSLPEYRFVGERTVECEAQHLADIGLAVHAERASIPDLSSYLFDYQRWIVERAFRRERFAVFADTGLGKTAMQLEWARLVSEHTGGRVLIVAPLNVCPQTIAEYERFYGRRLLDCTDRETFDAWLEDDDNDGLGITNYEKLEGVKDRLPVAGVVLDESSMLKAFGVRKFAVMKAFDGVRFKLACSATPAPNERTEYAQHAVFLGQVRSTTEYLTAYFVNRDGDWQFKAHAHDGWVSNLASWAVFVRDPKAWGFDDHLADLPEPVVTFPRIGLTDEQHTAAGRFEQGLQVSIFGATPGGVTSRTKLMQIAHGFELDKGEVVGRYPSEKPQWISDLICGWEHDEQVIVWVTFDEEGDQLAAMLNDRMSNAGEAVHISGRTPRARRAELIEAFRRGEGPRVLILKPAMFGHGMNLQSCHVQVFSTITDSFERYYQCVRRSYRYGQTKTVRVYVPLTPLDEAICSNVMAKQSTFLADAAALEAAVVARLRPADTSEVLVPDIDPQVELDRAGGQTWTLIHGDSIAHMPTMEPASVDVCVFSPPFASLYAYSKALGDMGNVRADAEFRLQWRWFAERLMEVMKPGRIVAIHCKEIIRFTNTHGYRHCYDFPSDLREGMVDAGFRYQRRITIAKNPQAEATRNKETSLLHVTLRRNALDSFPQTGEYLMVFTTPGDAEVPVPVPDVDFERWCNWANSIWPDWDTPTWSGIMETDVLNAEVAKEAPDERHVCPLQLGLIERVVRLWSNPGELVFSPFAGIGSEGWEAIAHGRRFYGVELKRSYFDTACRNLARREEETLARIPIFGLASSEVSA